MKRKLYLLVVPILGLNLYWFFSFYNASFKDKPKTITITNEEKEEIKLDIEDYIIGVVACEMPALYNEEALKAQAVASRTYAYYMLEKNQSIILTDTTDQCYIDEQAMHVKWADKYEEYYNKISSSVKSTANTVMLQDSSLFKSFYFSTSNGNTLDSLAVFKEGNITSVDSSWDKESKDYKKITTFTKEELASKLGNFNTITITKRDETHHVLEVKVDNKSYTGIEFRKLLNLRSTDFSIETSNGTYNITTLGYGHGVGMSQYGANYLANNFKTYKEILEYYYNDITIVNY